MTWTTEQLRAFEVALELEIAPRRKDGTLSRWTPIWVVRVGHDVYVRSWYRRDTGWFGRVLRTQRARVRVAGVDAEVIIEDVGGGPAALRAKIDSAYRDKYGRHSAENMISEEAAATTLQLLAE